MIEYEITIKGDTHRLSAKHISYEPLLASQENPDLEQQVNDLLDKFKQHDPGNEESPEVVIKFRLCWVLPLY